MSDTIDESFLFYNNMIVTYGLIQDIKYEGCVSVNTAAVSVGVVINSVVFYIYEHYQSFNIVNDNIYPIYETVSFRQWRLSYSLTHYITALIEQ